MSDPEIFHSNQPHQVSIPDGSHMAVAKTATQQEPSVHKVYRPGGGEEIEEIHPDHIVSSQTAEAPPRIERVAETAKADRTNLAKTPLSTPTEARAAAELPATNQAVAPKVLAPPPTSAKAATAAPVTAQALESHADSARANPEMPGLQMPEMDFPARVVHLRIENEQLRSRLENLEADS